MEGGSQHKEGSKGNTHGNRAPATLVIESSLATVTDAATLTVQQEKNTMAIVHSNRALASKAIEAWFDQTCTWRTNRSVAVSLLQEVRRPSSAANLPSSSLTPPLLHCSGHQG